MSLVRQIAVALVASLLGLAAAGLAAVAMMDGAPVSLEQAVPVQAVTSPMIGVIVFWLVGRALKVPLAPIQTFVYGAIVVYGTAYLLGRLITVTAISENVVLLLALAVIVGFAFHAVRRAVMDTIAP